MKYLKLLSFLTLLFICTSSAAQKDGPEISFGIVNADIKTYNVDWQEGSTWRKGAWVTLNQNHKIFKWLNVETGITYQERMPLEVFTFNWAPNGGTIGGVSYRYTFGRWPTNPQNEKYNTDHFVRFPNFKYLNFELVPNISIGNTLSITVGSGLFGGILLNRKETTTTASAENFPLVASAFGPPNNVNGEVIYNRYDTGWMPKIAVAYKINDKLKIGLLFKSYHSFIRLNDTFVTERALGLNMRWVAHAGGLSIQYEF